MQLRTVVTWAAGASASMAATLMWRRHRRRCLHAGRSASGLGDNTAKLLVRCSRFFTVASMSCMLCSIHVHNVWVPTGLNAVGEF